MSRPFLIVGMVLALALAAGYYFGYDHGWEGAVRPNSEMLERDGGLAVAASEIAYYETAKGYYAAPEAAGDYPGVVMIHEWWGLNGNIKDTARDLAEEGYRVLAVDLYGGKVGATLEEAQALRNAVDDEEAVANMRAAVAYLHAQGAARVGSLGWCFGGGKSLQLALSGERLNATVIYYGQLVTDVEELRAIRWPVLGIFGGADQSIPVATVDTFRLALKEIGIPNEVRVYRDVGHAFANPSGMTYAPKETMDAWERTLAFLGHTLKME